jgi:hypothetical protein
VTAAGRLQLPDAARRGRDGTWTPAGGAKTGGATYGPPPRLLAPYDPASADLYPTKTRLALLAEIEHPKRIVYCEARQVRSPISGICTALAQALARAGWCTEDRNAIVGQRVPVVLTAEGRRVLAKGLAAGKVAMPTWPTGQP